MSVTDLLGRSATLTIRSFGKPGAFLALDATADTVLLLGPEVPQGARVGDAVAVFLYKDSEGRPLATTATPKLAKDEVAFLEVTAVTEFGAFVDWGLPKQLLVPFAEQTADMRVGARYAIGLYLDASDRLAGTMKVSDLLRASAGRPGGRAWAQDEWVTGEAWRDEPEIGLFVILERRCVALLPKGEPHALTRGEAAKFRVANILPDGKLELSLRAHAHEELESDAKRVFEVLSRASAGAVMAGDRASPDAIKRTYGLSKKAFKRALGRLLKQRLIDILADGSVVLSKPPLSAKPAPPKRP